MFEIEFYDVRDNLICRHFYTEKSYAEVQTNAEIKSFAAKSYAEVKSYAEKVVSSWPEVCYAWIFSKFGNWRMYRCSVGLSLG